MVSNWCGRASVMSLLFVHLVAVLSLLPGCATRRVSPRTPSGFPETTAGSSEAIGALVQTALALQGTPYRNGGVDSSGFDCSGFVQYVFGQHGVALPRSVREQFQAGIAVPRDGVVPGDLVFFATTAAGASHVGIMVSGDAFVHAPSERGAVRVESLNGEYWARRYLGARRILAR